MGENRELKVDEYHLQINKVTFQEGKFECDEEHEKYYACDSDRAPVAVGLQPVTTTTIIAKNSKNSNVTQNDTSPKWVAGKTYTNKPKSFFGTLDAEYLVLALLGIGTTLLVTLLVAFAVVKVGQRIARSKFYKMREQQANKGDAQ